MSHCGPRTAMMKRYWINFNFHIIPNFNDIIVIRLGFIVTTAAATAAIVIMVLCVCLCVAFFFRGLIKFMSSVEPCTLHAARVSVQLCTIYRSTYMAIYLLWRWSSAIRTFVHFVARPFVFVLLIYLYFNIHRVECVDARCIYLNSMKTACTLHTRGFRSFAA